jgi:hypothetical protein
VKTIEESEDKKERQKKLQDAIERGALIEAPSTKNQDKNGKGGKKKQAKKEIHPIPTMLHNDLNLDFTMIRKFSSLQVNAPVYRDQLKNTISDL